MPELAWVGDAYLTKSGLRVFGFCPAGSTIFERFRGSNGVGGKLTKPRRQKIMKNPVLQIIRQAHHEGKVIYTAPMLLDPWLLDIWHLNRIQMPFMTEK